MPIQIASNLLPRGAGAFYLLEDRFIKGGHRVVANDADVLAIDTTCLKEGMSAYSASSGKTFSLSSDLKTWTEKQTSWQTLKDIPESVVSISASDVVKASMVGTPLGVVPLNSYGLIDAKYIAGGLDEIVEYASVDDFPAVAGAAELYVDTSTNKLYRWSGSGYVNVGAGAGTADAALKLSTSRTISATGDAAWSVAFDGSGNATASLTLAATGVNAGTYNDQPAYVRPLSFDSKGRLIDVGTAVPIAIPVSQISDSGTVGRDVIKSADAASALAAQGIANHNQISVTASGCVSFNSNKPVVSSITSAGPVTIDWCTASVFKVALGANTTFTFSNLEVGANIVLYVDQDATGSRTITWPSTVRWAGGTAPTVTTTAGKRDIYTFLSVDGVTWTGFVSGQNYATT